MPHNGKLLLDQIIKGQRTNFLDHSITGNKFHAIKASTKKEKEKERRNEITMSTKLT
jgi:hypothetical protein